MPSPQSSTPQLFDTTCRSVVPASCSAAISWVGTPQRPNPPTASDAPSEMSATAAAADSETLSAGRNAAAASWEAGLVGTSATLTNPFEGSSGADVLVGGTHLERLG